MVTLIKLEGTTSLEIVDISDFTEIFTSNAAFQNFHKICRFCLGFDNIKPFFDMTYKEVSVQSIISNCSSLEVNPNDHLPYHLCETCLAELIRCYKFKKRCIQTSKILQDAYNNRNYSKSNETAQQSNDEYYSGNQDDLIIKKEEIEDISIISNDSIAVDANSDNLIIKCRETKDTTSVSNDNVSKNSENFKIKSEIHDVLSICHVDIVEDWNCDNVMIKYEEIKEAPTISNDDIPHDLNIDDLSDNKLKNDTNDNFENNSDSVDKYCALSRSVTLHHQKHCTCNICTERLKKKEISEEQTLSGRKSSKWDNVLYTGEYGHACKCRKTFNTKVGLMSHMRVHIEKKPHICSVCNKCFNWKSVLRQHMLIHSGEKPQQCSVCKKSFTQKQYLDAHMRLHTGKGLHKCSVCQMSFIHKSLLNTHMLIHTGEKSHKCNICEKSFFRKTQLDMHTRIHTGDRPHKCTTCTKSFVQKSDLEKHVLVHADEKLHKCSVCEKSFTWKGVLTNHMLIHTGERPHKCTLCEKSFNRKSGLRSHMLIHTGERPYECSVCKKSFIRKQNLNKHMRIHMSDSSYKCDVCEETFIQKSHLEKHMSSHMDNKEIIGS